MKKVRPWKKTHSNPKRALFISTFIVISVSLKKELVFYGFWNFVKKGFTESCTYVCHFFLYVQNRQSFSTFLKSILGWLTYVEKDLFKSGHQTLRNFKSAFKMIFFCSKGMKHTYEALQWHQSSNQLSIGGILDIFYFTGPLSTNKTTRRLKI